MEEGETIVSFDPGMKNLGIWCGLIQGDQFKTLKLGRFNLIKNKEIPTYSAVCTLLDRCPWMCDPATVKHAVIESQPPRNVPARIVATALYGYLKGKGVKDVRFSGSKLKDKAIAFYGSKMGVEVTAKQKEMTKAQRYRLNKKNAVAVAHAIVGEEIRDIFGDKFDDAADALLLGCGFFLELLKLKTLK